MLVCAGRAARKRSITDAAAANESDTSEGSCCRSPAPRRRSRLGPCGVRSKNCANTKKALRTARRWESERQQIEDKRREIEQLERQLALANAARVTAFQNAQTSALQLVEAYHRVLQRGTRPTQRGGADALGVQRFIRSAISEDIRTLEFSGLKTFLQQWDFMSSYHTGVNFRADRVELFPVQGEAHMYPTLATRPPDEPVFVVQSTGNTTLRISRATIEHIFPHALRDEQLVQWLIGKTYSFAFTMYSHVSASGRIFQMESRVDLISSLMNLLQDPRAALNMSNSAAISSTGNLLLQDEVREAQYTLANRVL